MVLSNNYVNFFEWSEPVTGAYNWEQKHKKVTT